MVTEAVKLITGAGRSLLGRVLVLDALASSWRTLDVRPDPARVPVTALADEVVAARDEPELPVVSAEQLQRELASAAPPVVVDVREPAEHAASALPGARLAPLVTVLDGSADLPRDRPVVLHRAAGSRSARALAALLAAGDDDVRHLDGGLTAWLRAGGAVASSVPWASPTSTTTGFPATALSPARPGPGAAPRQVTELRGASWPAAPRSSIDLRSEKGGWGEVRLGPGASAGRAARACALEAPQVAVDPPSGPSWTAGHWSASGATSPEADGLTVQPPGRREGRGSLGRRCDDWIGSGRWGAAWAGPTADGVHEGTGIRHLSLLV